MRRKREEKIRKSSSIEGHFSFRHFLCSAVCSWLVNFSLDSSFNASASENRATTCQRFFPGD